jgi:hypothetical protein
MSFVDVIGAEMSRSDHGYRLVLATVFDQMPSASARRPRVKDREWIIPRLPAAGFSQLAVTIAGRQTEVALPSL